MYQLEYRVSLQHWSEYAGLVQSRTQRAGLSKRLGSSVIDALVAGGIAGFGLYAAHSYFNISDSLGMAILGAFVLFYSLGIIVCARHLRARDAGNPARDGFLIGQRSTTVTEEHVEVVSDRVKTRFEWRAFERVERLPRMIVLWLEPGAGVVIPRSAFQSDGEAAGFYEFATDCINQPAPSKRKKLETAPAKAKPADAAVTAAVAGVAAGAAAGAAE